ncbi:hypothetical protein BDN67DRAFT_322444 [Paxillus ammoniavirescens]|nr:hypothetical protein BDN67DRAFT_322444 [Paxillus ammoniavirescens]
MDCQALGIVNYAAMEETHGALYAGKYYFCLLLVNSWTQHANYATTRARVPTENILTFRSTVTFRGKLETVCLSHRLTLLNLKPDLILPLGGRPELDCKTTRSNLTSQTVPAVKHTHFAKLSDKSQNTDKALRHTALSINVISYLAINQPRARQHPNRADEPPGRRGDGRVHGCCRYRVILLLSSPAQVLDHCCDGRLGELRNQYEPA